ncbi:MAG: SpoIIE family protein phosphatase [Leptospiraceae bacterium]|nr:SpoIIE family protein phosphatase [Leptospiraceae bacterium]
MRKKIKLIFLFLISLSSSIQPEELIKIDLIENSQPMKIGKFFEYIEDENGKLEFDEILKYNLNWKKPESENLNFGFRKSFYWLRFTVNNHSKAFVKPILEFGWARQDYIEFYNFKKDKYDLQVTGDLFPFSQREIDDTHFVFELEIEPKTQKTYYIKTRSINNISLLNPALHSSFKSFHKAASFRDLSNGILYGFLVIMIFYNLFLFIVVKEKVYLFLSFYILSFGYTLLAQHGIAFQYFYPDNTWLANRDGSLNIPILLILQILFLNSYLELKIKLPLVHKFSYSYIFLLLLYLISMFTIFKNHLEYIYYSILVMIFIENIFYLGLGIYLSLKKFRPAYFYLISWAMLLLGIFLRVLSGSSIIPLNFFTFWSFQFGLSAMLILISIGLADKINYLKRKLVKTNRKLKDYSDLLEDRISKRTQELQSTLDTVNELKKQQDGDYFLTSLLLEPFVANKGSSSKVNIEFLLIQKKKFEFYGKEQNIGGDLCHTENIMINDHKYILFFNSDAMGKSLQGAGGAIVFGSVFFSIIQRTKKNLRSENIPPERWLKDTFVELHKVFLTFECTMLVSAVIGLIEENTGLLYYINAEHPWLVLYADNTCNFIEKEIYFTKLGSPVDSNKVFVNLYQMKKNDAIFIGSDGRDDFIPKNSLNDAILNQDETEFLKTVVEANGDLSKIYEITNRKGQIIDDYSLVKIKYQGEDTDYSHLKKLSLENYHNNKFGESLSYGMEYTEKNPADTDFLLFLGTVYKSENLPQKALLYFERVRLRNPYHLENLLLLIEVYIGIKNTNKARKILKDYTLLDPDNQQIARLGKELEILNEENT